jgi:cell division protein FtsL
VTRLNLFLLSIAITCALSVITSQHKARKLYGELQKQDQEAKQLEVEWGRLLLEQSTWAMHSRVEQEATRRIGMQVLPPNRTKVILPRTRASAVESRG